MSYFINDDFHKAGLPELFKIEDAFEDAACDEAIARHEKCRVMIDCLDRIGALIETKRATEPETVFLLIDEASRFVSDNSGNMARGIVRKAFLDTEADIISLQTHGFIKRLNKMERQFERLMACPPDCKM